MSGSLRSQLLWLLTLLVAAAVLSGVVMVGLFQQSARARVGQADALIGRACDSIGEEYRFYTAGASGPVDLATDAVQKRKSLEAVVLTALRNRADIEGGLWSAQHGSLAYAFPTYEGNGPKKDLPDAERPRIQSLNEAAASAGRPVSNHYDSASQTLLIAACPLQGLAPGMTAWTMTRIHTFAGASYVRLMAGLGVLLASVLAAAAISVRLAASWSSHVSDIEHQLIAHNIADLPLMEMTGRRELDRIIVALNDAVRALSMARERDEVLSRRVTAAERLAAMGRVTAGIAHEIRNPIAAMRLKVENAQASGQPRKDEALSFVLEQVGRLETLVRSMLNVTDRVVPTRTLVDLVAFLARLASENQTVAAARQLTIEARDATTEPVLFDAEQMRRAMGNLIANAVVAAPTGSTITLWAVLEGNQLVFAVIDQGSGPPEHLRAELFEPFVTGRPDGTGLGLSIVRETANAHGGTARFSLDDRGTVFEIAIPWQIS